MSTVTYPSVGASDPLVPGDGTQNITGALTVSGNASIGNNLTLASNGNTGLFMSGTGTSLMSEVKSGATDGAGVVAVRLSANADLTTSGAKILSVGDNAGTSYAEKMYVDKDGGIVTGSGGGLTVGSGVIVLNAAAPVLQNNAATQMSLGTNFVKVNGGFGAGGITAEKTTDYVATSSDFLVPVNVNTTGDVAVTLPAANALKGQILTIKATATHATRDININRAGADTIYTPAGAGATTFQLSPTATLSSATLISDGTSAWFIIAHIA